MKVDEEEINIKLENTDVHEGHSLISSILEGVKKKYKCEKCGKAYSKAQHLKYHINSIHYGIKNQKCEICGITFSLSGDLNRHISSVHEGAKAFKCEICNKTFTRASGVNRHMKTAHEGRDKYFPQKSKLFRNRLKNFETFPN